MSAEKPSIWKMKDISPDGAYQMGAMVANMIKAALENAIEDASAQNLEAFRLGMANGLGAIGIDASVLHHWVLNKAHEHINEGENGDKGDLKESGELKNN
jgi:hypothetical protein